MTLTGLLSSLTSLNLPDSALEALNLERKRSTTQKALIAAGLVGVGAIVGGAMVAIAMRTAEAKPLSKAAARAAELEGDEEDEEEESLPPPKHPAKREHANGAVSLTQSTDSLVQSKRMVDVYPSF